MCRILRFAAPALLVVVIIASVPLAGFAAPITNNPYIAAFANGQLASPFINQPVSPSTMGLTPPSSPEPAPAAPSPAMLKDKPGPTYLPGSLAQVVRLKYLKAEHAKGLLSLLIPEDRMKVENLNNSLIIMANEDEFNGVKALLSQIDLPARQVMFEVEAIEIQRSDVKNLGIDWGTMTQLPGAPITDGSAFVVSLQGIGMPGYSINIMGQINRLLENKKGRMLAKPRVAALDGQTAQILIGDKLAIENRTIVGGSEVISVTYIDVGVKLEVTPFINDDGYITTKIKPEVSNKTDVTKNGNPNIRTRQAETTLRVKSGQTIILGGLYQTEEISDEFKVPLLGDIPLIGHLFRSKASEKRDTELVILLTPRIMVDN